MIIVILYYWSTIVWNIEKIQEVVIIIFLPFNSFADFQSFLSSKCKFIKKVSFALLLIQWYNQMY